MLLIPLALWLLFGFVLYVYSRRPPRIVRRALPPKEDAHRFGRKKPAWVPKEVIRLKALMPREGVRTISAVFNLRYKPKGETASKSYVADVIKHNALAIQIARQRIKNRPRKQGPRGLTFAMDLTFVHPDVAPVLGILDHGTRALLAFRELHARSTIGVLRILLDVIEAYGRPRFLRTDNEGIFTSHLMSLALLFLGIRPQRIDPFCPWQNGRVERVFRTLKEKLFAWWKAAGVPDHLQVDLDTVRAWYNHARPHQSLHGITPAMAWAGLTQSQAEPIFVEAWEGILAGFVVHT